MVATKNFCYVDLQNAELLHHYSQIQNDSHKEVDIDDSSETCSVSDDILLTNSD